MKKFKVYDDYGELEIESTECCGIYELHSLNEKPVNAIAVVLENINRDYPMIIFHDVVDSNGDKLCRFIRRHKLGKVQQSLTKQNPNTNNLIRMWIWYPDYDAIRSFEKRLKFVEDYPWLL